VPFCCLFRFLSRSRRVEWTLFLSAATVAIVVFLRERSERTCLSAARDILCCERIEHHYARNKLSERSKDPLSRARGQLSVAMVVSIITLALYWPEHSKYFPLPRAPVSVAQRKRRTFSAATVNSIIGLEHSDQYSLHTSPPLLRLFRPLLPTSKA
jgi:hypothetical protein